MDLLDTNNVLEENNDIGEIIKNNTGNKNKHAIIGKNSSESSLIKNVWNGKKIGIKEFENNFERSKRKNFFAVARDNAINRLFELIKLSQEDMTNFFKIEQDSFGNGIANIKEYDWVYKTSGVSNIIPLDEYITQPSKIVNGERVPVLFYVSYFFRNSEFLKKCEEYYRQYNIEFKIVKLKTKDLWKIILKVTDPKFIVFTPSKI